MIILSIAFFVLLLNLVLTVCGDDMNQKKMYLVLPSTITIFFLYLFVITESLSFFQSFSFKTLFVSWCVFFLINIIFIVFKVIRKKTIIVQKKIIFRVELFSSVFLYALFSVFMIVLAYNTVPYNNDSMAYHLPRVMHWAQQKSVNHYAAHYYLQVSSPVLGDYIHLNNYVLSNYSDEYICLNQCFSYLINGILIYQIAKMIGCKKQWATVAVIVFFALPITFGEALNTQVDLMTPLFVLSLVLYIIYLKRYIEEFKNSKKLLYISFCMGICTGLSFLSKYTSAFAMIPFIIWLLIICLKNKIAINKIFICFLFGGVSALVIFIPEALRMMKTFGSLFSESVSSGQMVETLNPKLIFLCFVKNLCSNLSGHYLYKSKTIVIKFVNVLARILGVNIVDPRISYYDFYDINEPFEYNHDLANGNVIVILFLLSILLLLIKRIQVKKEESKNVIEFGGYVVSAFFAFIIFLSVLKFTTHRARYEITFFALLCPAVCLIFQQKIKISLQQVIRTIIIFVSVCEIINMAIYHIDLAYKIGKRPDGYFAFSALIHGHKRCVKMIKENEYETLGLINKFIFDYPLWVMNKNENIKRIEDVNVENETSIHENQDFFPDCVLYVGLEPFQGKELYVHGKQYLIVENFFDGYYGYYAIAENSEYLINR